MRVGINARVFSVSEPGGSPVAGINLTEEILKSDRVETVLFGNNDLNQRFPKAEVVSSYFPVNSQMYGVVWEQTVLRQIIKKHDIEALLCPNNNGIIIKPDTHMLTWLHDIYTYKGDVATSYKLLQRLRMPRVLSNSDTIVAVSEFTKSEIVDTFGTPEEKISVVPNGVQNVFFGDDSTPVGLPDEYLLYVGDLNTRKNIPRLIEAFNELRSEYGIPHDLVLIGPESKSFYNYPIVDVDNDDIHNFGFVSKLELKYAYENAAVFLFPSLYEGFGMAALESMACGTPVVAGNRASLPEVLDNAAILVNPEDPSKIAEETYNLLVDQQLRSKLVRRGSDRASQYTWKKSANRMIDIIEQTR